KIDYVYLDPEILATDAAAGMTDADIRAYYDEHKESYRRGERARIRYVEFEPPVTAADSAAAASKADSLVGLARAEDADFAALARRHSDDPVSSANGGDIGWMRPEALDPAIQTAVAALSPGQVADPVPTPFGWHIVRLEARSEGQSQLRQILVAIEPGAQGRDQMRQAAQAFSRDASASPDGFAQAAARGNLRVQEPPAFEKGITVPGLGSAAELTDFVFANDRNAVSGPIEREGSFYVVQVLDRYPEGYVSVEQVADEIRDELGKQREIERTRELAPQIADAIRGQGLEAAALRFGLEVQATDWFTRINNIPGIGSGSPIAGAAFGLAQGQVAGPVESSRGLYFVRLVDRQPPDEEGFQREKDALRQELRGEKMRERFNAWFEARREAAEIEDRRAQLLGA
ncbi:MAG TPA: peptidyl-prolyl cis-trans isomerase, partial [Vicinamibacteria bacterium]